MCEQLQWQTEQYQDELTWNEALEYAKNLREGGFDNWRVPTIKELISLVDYSKSNLATDLPDMEEANYWSSTSSAHNSNGAWIVGFSNGYVYANSKTDSYYVRCVRYDY